MIKKLFLAALALLAPVAAHAFVPVRQVQISTNTLTMQAGGINIGSATVQGATISTMTVSSFTATSVTMQGVTASTLTVTSSFTATVGTFGTLTASGTTTLGGTNAPVSISSNTATQHITDYFGAGVKISTSVYFSPTTAGIRGTTAQDNADFGNVGESSETIVLEANKAVIGQGVNGQWASMSTFTLTSGDWDVTLVLGVDPNGATGATTVSFGISATTGNNSTGLSFGANAFVCSVNVSNSGFNTCSIPINRITIASTTTYYFKTMGTFLTACPKVYGRMTARRIR